MIKWLILVVLLAGCSTASQVPTTHNSYRVALEQAILSTCGVDVDIRQTAKYTASNGTISGEVTEIACLPSPLQTVLMTPPHTREDTSSLDIFTLHYEIEFLGTVLYRMRACDVNNICSVWKIPD